MATVVDKLLVALAGDISGMTLACGSVRGQDRAIINNANDAWAAGGIARCGHTQAILLNFTS